MATSAALDYTYKYPFASEVGELDQGFGLRLSSCGANQENTYFFNGTLRQPRCIGDMLLVLSDIVLTHFFLPRIPMLDFVVTISDNTEALTEISRFSDLHAYTVASILLGWLENQTELPRDAHYVLSLLSELLNQLCWPLSEEQQLPLKSIKGSSKTAKLAKSLMELEFTDYSSVYKEAMPMQLESRID